MPPEGPLRHWTPAGLQLIETLRWEPAGGFIRLDRHLARLAASAEALGFACNPHDAIASLHAAVTGETSSLRIRLTLDSAGKAEVTTQPFASLPADTVWRLRIASTRLDSADPLLRHKTTRRDLYDRARAEFSRDEADEVLLLNERKELCEGTITSLFVDPGHGPLLTPALECGLLAGVLRAEMIESGQAVEAVLDEVDLRSAKATYVGNSLRGVIPAEIA